MYYPRAATTTTCKFLLVSQLQQYIGLLDAERSQCVEIHTKRGHKIILALILTAVKSTDPFRTAFTWEMQASGIVCLL